MPGGGGPAVFSFLQQQRPHLVPRTVFVSGEFAPNMSEVIGRGYAKVLTKPFTLADLAETAREVLAGCGDAD